MKRALDLFCGAGGATRGLQMAGFHVTGVDINPQPRYCGDAFHQADALSFLLEGFDFIWASPPCQAFCSLRFMPTAKEHPNLIPGVRARLLACGAQYVIENVEGAPLGDCGYLIMLCGTMFGLETADGRAELRRHRLFETSFSIPLRPACQHSPRQSLSVTGTGLDSNLAAWQRRTVISVLGHGPEDGRGRLANAARGRSQVRDSITVAGKRAMGGTTGRRAITVTGSTPQTNVDRNRTRETFSIADARAAMGIDWMTMRGLSQAIPPVYSQFIGRHAMEILQSATDKHVAISSSG